jgi:hypothetical protein
MHTLWQQRKMEERAYSFISEYLFLPPVVQKMNPVLMHTLQPSPILSLFSNKNTRPPNLKNIMLNRKANYWGWGTKLSDKSTCLACVKFQVNPQNEGGEANYRKK